MIKGVRFHYFEKQIIAPIKRHMEFNIMHDCNFGHYFVTPAWTYNDVDFELVWTGFPYGLLGVVLYVSLCIISF